MAEVRVNIITRGIRAATAAMGRFARSLSGVSRKSREAAKGQEQFEKQTSRAGKAAGRMGSDLKRLLGAFVGLFVIRRVTRAMLGFETTMAEVATIAQGGSEQVEVFRKQIIALSREVPQSADQLGAGLYQILSSGITDTAEAMEVLRVSSKAAVAGLTDTATAVDAITGIINAFSLTAADAAEVADILFETVRLGKLRFEDIAQNIGTASTSAALAGVTIQELTAALAAMTLVSVDSAEAASSLNRLFLTLVLQTPAQEAAFKRLGVEFSVAAVKSKGFATVLDEINTLTEANIDELAKLFPSIRAARSAFILAGDSAQKFNDIIDELIGSQGAMEKAFQIMNKTASNQATLMKNELIAVFLDISVVTLPGLSAAMRFTARAIRVFVGGLQIMAIDIRVFFAETAFVVAQMPLLILKSVQFVLRSVSNFTRKIGEAAGKLAALPGATGDIFNVIAKANTAVADSLGDAAEGFDGLIAGQRAQLAIRDDELDSLRQAAEARKIAIVLEGDLLKAGRAAAAERAGVAAAVAEVQRLDAAEQKKRAALQKRLTQEVNDITLSSTQQQLMKVGELRDEWIRVFGEISDEAEAKFKIIEDAAAMALRAEVAGEFAENFRASVERLIEDRTAGLGGEARIEVTADIRERALERLRELQTAIGKTAEEEAALNELIREQQLELAKLEAQIGGFNQSQQREAQLAAAATAALKTALIDSFTALGEELGDILAGVANGMSSFTQVITKILASLLKTIGKVLIAHGVAGLAIKSFISNPFAAIAAGIALVALGSALSSPASGAVTSAGASLAGGGGGFAGTGLLPAPPAFDQDRGQQQIIIQIVARDLNREGGLVILDQINAAGQFDRPIQLDTALVRVD